MNKFYGKSYESNFGNVSASDHPARFSGFIMTAEILSLLILGGAALFGLQGSLAMAMRHYLFRNQSRRSACDRLLGSPEAYIGPIPVALVASFYYALVLILLLRMLLGGDNPMALLTPLILFSLPVTGYYAWLLFYKLRLLCMGCLRIYLANFIICAAWGFIFSL